MSFYSRQHTLSPFESKTLPSKQGDHPVQRRAILPISDNEKMRRSALVILIYWTMMEIAKEPEGRSAFLQGMPFGRTGAHQYSQSTLARCDAMMGRVPREKPAMALGALIHYCMMSDSYAPVGREIGTVVAGYLPQLRSMWDSTHGATCRTRSFAREVRDNGLARPLADVVNGHPQFRQCVLGLWRQNFSPAYDVYFPSIL